MTAAMANAENSMAQSPAQGTTQISHQGRDFTMERIFDAPRELVFRVWSDPHHISQWWGPKDWTLPVCRMDFRPGGLWIYGMKGPDGMESWGRATYQEIVPPERIVYVDAFADEQGNVLEDLPQMVITVEFIDMGGKTKLISTTRFATEADLEQALGMGMAEGATQMFDRLDDYLVATTRDVGGNKSALTFPSDREIRMSRTFDAPRELVFRALTDPQMIPQWWGLRSTITIVDKLDVRPGGAWRFIERDASGHEEGFRGVFREITPPERVVQTFEWEGLPGHIVVDTLTLEELPGGRTGMTTTSLFDSMEDRDGMLASGMETGANESWDRLAELLAKQA